MLWRPDCSWGAGETASRTRCSIRTSTSAFVTRVVYELVFVYDVRICRRMHMSLHRILSLFVIVLAALALGAAISLAWLTSYLHRTTVELETALQSVRIA